MGSPLRSFLISAFLLATAAGQTFAAPAVTVQELPVSDPALEQRLEVETFYRTKKGESLRSVARLLYGHETWWSKLQTLNPGMKGMNPDWKIPSDTRIRYLAGRVDKNYIVQPGDWLVRIATWKYGEAQEWEKVYRENASAIANPDLIRPGDRLAFLEDGTMYNATTNQRVLNGLPREISAKAERAIAAVQERPEGGLSMLSWFGIGGLAGLLLYYLLLQRRRLAPGAGPELSSSLTLGSEDTAPAVTAPAKPAEARRGGYYETFQRRPPEQYRVDTDLVRYEDGQAAKPTGYDLIMPNKLKKYLGLKKTR